MTPESINCVACGKLTSQHYLGLWCIPCYSRDKREYENRGTGAPKDESTISKSEYGQYIRSNTWIKKAGKLKRKQQQCSLCFRSKKEVKLNVHHKTYLRLGAEQQSDLVVICEDCHKLFSKNYQYNDSKGFHEPIRNRHA